MMRRLPLLALSLPLLLSTPAWAKVDCVAMRDVEANVAYKENVRGIETDCITGAYDPPVPWRPDDGQGAAARVSSGGGFVGTGIQAPEKPPAVRGMKPSVSNAKINFANSFPPWPGFPCQLPGGVNVCDWLKDEITDNDNDDPKLEDVGTDTGEVTPGSGTATPGDLGACPVRDDTTGTFGQKKAITGSSSYSLACGGAMPLSIYQMTLTKNPAGMASTEYGSPYLWNYNATKTANGTIYKATSAALPLPTYLCRMVDGVMVKSVTLGAPIAQIITYSGPSTGIAIRLIAENAPADPMFPSATPEKYLIVPLKSGKPQIPPDCADEETYYKPLTNTGGDITFESSIEANCEGYGDYCAKSSKIPNADGVSNSNSCDTATIYPPNSNAAGAVDCSATLQMIDTDRPNLVFGSGTSAASSAIEGRTAVLATTTTGSKIYTASGSIIRLNKGATAFTVSEGGIVALANGGRLVMYAPATINTSNGSIILTNGGELQDVGGTSLAKYPAKTSVQPTVVWPMAVRLNRAIDIPAGYAIPSQPSPYIRGPVNEPK